MIAIAVALIFIVAATLGIALTTRDLDERMEIIVFGLSRVAGCVVLLLISVEAPRWTGVYYRHARENSALVGSFLKVLRFNVFCSILRQFALIYFFLWPFYCGVQAATIPVSVVTGIAFGFSVDAGVFLARRRLERGRNIISYVMAFLFAIGSSLLFAAGVVYIASVWENEDLDTFTSYPLPFFCWFAFSCLIHFFLWWNTRKLRQADKDTRVADGSERSRPRMAMSLIVENFSKAVPAKAIKDKSTEMDHLPDIDDIEELPDIEESDEGQGDVRAPETVVEDEAKVVQASADDKQVIQIESKEDEVPTDDEQVIQIESKEDEVPTDDEQVIQIESKEDEVPTDDEQVIQRESKEDEVPTNVSLSAGKRSFAAGVSWAQIKRGAKSCQGVVGGYCGSYLFYSRFTSSL
jgi:hypothetical protein